MNDVLKLLLEADGAIHGSLGDPRLDEEARAAGEGIMWTESSERRGQDTALLLWRPVYAPTRMAGV